MNDSFSPCRQDWGTLCERGKDFSQTRRDPTWNTSRLPSPTVLEFPLKETDGSRSTFWKGAFMNDLCETTVSHDGPFSRRRPRRGREKGSLCIPTLPPSPGVSCTEPSSGGRPGTYPSESPSRLVFDHECWTKRVCPKLVLYYVQLPQKLGMKEKCSENILRFELIHNLCLNLTLMWTHTSQALLTRGRGRKDYRGQTWSNGTVFEVILYSLSVFFFIFSFFFKKKTLGWFNMGDVDRVWLLLVSDRECPIACPG